MASIFDQIKDQNSHRIYGAIGIVLNLLHCHAGLKL